MKKEIMENQRNRKVMLTQVDYELPEINEDRYILDSEYTEESKNVFEAWFDSLRNKSAERITDSIFVESW